jgi:hypothetical protein
MSLPATLADWISSKGKIHPPRLLWTPLEAFFEENGYILFEGEVSTYPKDKVLVRAPDDYHHWIPEAEWGPNESCYQTLVSQGFIESVSSSPRADKLVVFTAHSARRRPFTRWQRCPYPPHSQSRRRLGSPRDSSQTLLPLPHRQPCKSRPSSGRELAKDDMIFAVFPLVDDNSFSHPWFQTVVEVFEALEQVLEVSSRNLFSLRRVFWVLIVFDQFFRVWHFSTAISLHIESVSFAVAGPPSLTDPPAPAGFWLGRGPPQLWWERRRDLW